MNIKTIGVTYTRRFNLGNFESAELSCSMWARISDYEDEITCTQILWDHARESVREEYIKIRNGSQPVEVIQVNTDVDRKPENEEDFEYFLPEADVYKKFTKNDDDTFED
jgi:hypothetical protein